MKLNEKDKQVSNFFVNMLSYLMKRDGLKYDSQVYGDTDISQARFSALRNGTAVPKASELLMIADFFDVTVDDLITDRKKQKEDRARAVDFASVVDLFFRLDEYYPYCVRITPARFNDYTSEIIGSSEIIFVIGAGDSVRYDLIKDFLQAWQEIKDSFRSSPSAIKQKLIDLWKEDYIKTAAVLEDMAAQEDRKAAEIFKC